MHKLILTYLSDPRNGALSRSFDAVKWLAKSKGEKSNGGSYGYYDEVYEEATLEKIAHTNQMRWLLGLYTLHTC